MPVNPPFNIIPLLAGMQTNMPNPIAQGISQVGDVGAAAFNQVAKRRQEEKDLGQKAVNTLISTFDLKPADPAKPGGIKAQDILSLLTGGKLPKGIPSELLGMVATPRSDMSALARVLPTVINNQQPGKETPLGDIVEPGAIPGLKPEATVSPQERKSGSGSGPTLDAIMNQASTAARALVGQRIAVALPTDPIIDPKTSKEEYLREVKREAKLRGADEMAIEERLSAMRKDLDKEEASFEADLKDAKTVLSQTQDPSMKKKVRDKLSNAYPMFVGHIKAQAWLR